MLTVVLRYKIHIKSVMEFTKDMQIIATVLGNEAAMKLMKEAGGVCLYVPKPDNRGLVMEYLKANGFNTKLVAVMLNISQRKVEMIHREYRKMLKASQQ